MKGKIEKKIFLIGIAVITVLFIVALIFTDKSLVITHINNKADDNAEINSNKEENEDEEKENDSEEEIKDTEEQTETEDEETDEEEDNNTGGSNNDDTNSGADSTDNSTNNSNNNTDNNGNGEDTTETKPEEENNGAGNNDGGSEEDTTVPTKNPLETENENLINEILNTYRISILYNEQANFYYNGDPGVKTTSNDAEEVNYSLKAIKTGLSNMPQSILDTLRLSRGFNVVLFKEVPGGSDGLAVITSHVYQILLDVDNWQQERIFYHETFHLMERYMYLQNGSSDPFPEWNTYNPPGFTYAYNDGKYLYIDESVPIIERAFVSKYAKTNAGEDRAELFEDLMHRPYKYYYMEAGYGINEKAKYLDQIIDKYFGVIPGAKWKRWITW